MTQDAIIIFTIQYGGRANIYYSKRPLKGAGSTCPATVKFRVLCVDMYPKRAPNLIDCPIFIMNKCVLPSLLLALLVIKRSK